jgi:hypothetical protein
MKGPHRPAWYVALCVLCGHTKGGVYEAGRIVGGHISVGAGVCFECDCPGFEGV